jgi:predicted MPP superfamily phosphohydrolase
MVLRISRRRFLSGVAAVSAVGVVGVGGEALTAGAHDLVVERIEIRSARVPPAFDGFTVAHLSDFHYDPYFSGPVIAAAVARTNELKPDVVLLTGDYVTEREFHRGRRDPPGASAALPCAKLLSGLQSRLGTVAVLGNHESFTDPDFVVAALKAHGLHVLRNESMPLEQGGGRVWLAGIDDVLGGDGDLDATLKGIPDNEFRILLAHEPDFADRASTRRVDLQLSGHSHGGQIRLPWIGPLYLPELGRKYPWGLRKIGGLTLYTNRGIGTIVIPARLNAPPEIAMITLRTV